MGITFGLMIGLVILIGITALVICFVHGTYEMYREKLMEIENSIRRDWCIPFEEQHRVWSYKKLKLLNPLAMNRDTPYRIRFPNDIDRGAEINLGHYPVFEKQIIIDDCSIFLDNLKIEIRAHENDKGRIDEDGNRVVSRGWGMVAPQQIITT